MRAILGPFKNTLSNLSLITKCTIMGLAILFSLQAKAADVPFNGSLPNDDAVLLFEFTISTAQDVVLRTYSYAGGTTPDSTIVPSGGFDPILSVFDSNGDLIGSNDDGAPGQVNQDPVTGSYFDTYLELIALPAGTYTVAVSQFSNFPAGSNLSDGFTGSGTTNFMDINGDTRSGSWFFEAQNVDAAAVDDVIDPDGNSLADPVAVPTMAHWSLAVLTMLMILIARRETAVRKTILS